MGHWLIGATVVTGRTIIMMMAVINDVLVPPAFHLAFP